MALNAVGLFKFNELTVAGAARDAAADPDLTEGQRYYAELYAVMKERQDYNVKHPDDLQGGIDHLRRTARELGRMSPPDLVAVDHNDLLRLFRQAATDGERMLRAVRAQDRRAVAELAPRLAASDRRQPQILDRITKKLQVAEPDPSAG